MDVGAVPVDAMVEEFPAGYSTVLDDIIGLDEVAKETRLVINGAVSVVRIVDVELDRG